MEISNFPKFHSPITYNQSSFYSLLKPFNYPSFSSPIHHQIRVFKSPTKFKRKPFRLINCSTSLKDFSNFDNSIAIADNIWSEFQFVEVMSIGNRVDSIIDFCLSSNSTSNSLRFWNVVGRESSRGQLRRRVLEKDDYPNIAEAPLNQQLHLKAVVLVASAGYGDEYITAIDILKVIRSSGGLAVAVIVKPFSFEGQRRQDEVKILVDELQNCANFCIDIDIDTLLKMEMVTLDEALKTAYQAVLSAIKAVSILISDTYKKHIQSFHGSMSHITVGEALTVLGNYNKGRVGFGVANNVKASIVQAVYDCPFLSIRLKDLDGVVICIFSSSSPIGDADVSPLVRTFREITGCTKEVIVSTVLNPDLKPNLISTTVITVCANVSDGIPLQNSSILSRLVDSIPFVFKFLGRHDVQSGKSEENSQRENIFPPMPANLTNEMLLDENCDEEEFEDDETDKVQFLDSDGHLSKCSDQLVQGELFGRKLFINRNLRPGYRISQDSLEEEPNVSGADPLSDYRRVFQLPVGVRLSDNFQDACDKSNLNHPEVKTNEEVQTQASKVPSLNEIQDVGFDAVTGFWNNASVLLKKKQSIISKKQGGLSARAASMLESERDTKTKWNPVMEIGYRGGVYKGRCQGGLPEGRGLLTLVDGTIYDGMWRYGKRSGIGSLFFSNGDVFHGSWRDDLIHGKGWLYFHTGERWFANFWKGRANGEGRFYSKYGEVIFGHFQDGWRHGQFLHVKVDGTRFVETWDDGVLTSSEELDS